MQLHKSQYSIKVIKIWYCFDFEDFLVELGLNEKIGTDEFILYPNRTTTTKTIMTDLSRGFSHYKEGAGIKKDISLSILRKTYLTWHHQVLGDDTGLVSSTLPPKYWRNITLTLRC